MRTIVLLLALTIATSANAWPSGGDISELCRAYHLGQITLFDPSPCLQLR